MMVLAAVIGTILFISWKQVENQAETTASRGANDLTSIIAATN